MIAAESVYVGTPSETGDDSECYAMEAWCKENCKGQTQIRYSRKVGYAYHILFEIKEEATLFALKWV